MLHAVPDQPAHPEPVHSREEAFRRHVEEAVQQQTGPDAVARIMQLYSADMGALSARIEGLAAEASESAAQKRTYFNMLTQVQMAASHKLWEGAKMSADLATYREMVDSFRHYTDKAAGEPVPWETLAAVLAMEPLEPAYRPVILAFLASEQFRGASFVSELGDVTIVLTFVGWALVDHGPGAYGVVEPMFLVGDRAMPKSSVEAERHVRMEGYLPHLERVAS